jgi:hypothetical protein
MLHTFETSANLQSDAYGTAVRPATSLIRTDDVKSKRKGQDGERPKKKFYGNETYLDKRQKSKYHKTHNFALLYHLQ